MDDYRKLKAIIDEIDELINRQVSSSDPMFKAWKTKADRLLIKAYGQDSYEFTSFAKISYTLSAYVLGTPDSAFVNACRVGLNSAKAILMTYLDELKESDVLTDKNSVHPIGNSVFIVHGRDDAARLSVARLIEKQGIKAIILNEQPNRGKTIIEKIESFSDVGAAICLFTADDKGRLKTEQDDNSRARQNVVFEAGYFIGKLGRERVITVVETGVELPSDLQGIVYTASDAWKVDLLKELKAIGYSIDLNELY